MGITVAEFDPDTGMLSAPRMVIETRDPAHFTLSADGKHLYMCNTGTPGGVSAFAVDQKTAALTLLNYKESKGRGPELRERGRERALRARRQLRRRLRRSAIRSRRTARWISRPRSCSTKARACIRSARPSRTHTGSAPIRPTSSAWWRISAPTRSSSTKFDAQTGKLAPNDPPATKVAGGQGPRHLAFHPNGKWVYAHRRDGQRSHGVRLGREEGHVDAVPGGEDAGGRIHGPPPRRKSPCARTANSCTHRIAAKTASWCTPIDANSGELTFKQRTPSRGKVPRYFTFDPTNKWLIVSNQEGGNVAVFSVDAKTGELAPQRRADSIGEADGGRFPALSTRAGNLLRRVC